LTEGTPKYNNTDLRYIKQTRLDTHVTILIVDEKISLVMEIRDDSKGTFDEAIGLSTYSNSRAGVLSYISIFENLWLQTELYDQIKESSMRLEQANEQLIAHDKIQKEFINIAAHELKTPIQPILGLTEVLRSQIKDVKQQELLEITIRNAKRLRRLSNDILDVSKIEGKSLELNKEEFNLNDVVINTITDITSGRDFLKHEKIKLLYNPHQDILIKADKGRISQVISNLLNNAIEFTGEGTILVSVEKNKISNDNEIIVSVKDSGQGIDQSILPRLFTKFASKYYKGTGLGLFISKGIIEAHGGKIWGENNPDGRGANFSFSLPIS
jgi:signal transduction histidine kinase